MFLACAAPAFGSDGQQPLYAEAPIDPARCAVEDDSQGWAARALNRSLTPQLGLPAVPHPADNAPSIEKIELGRKLFFDRRLSINRTMSCAMCHVPEQGFTTWELQSAVGVEGRSVKRNSPTILNSAFLNPLFHDGRDVALETQFVAPLVARNEMANPSAGWVVAFLNRDDDYIGMFQQAFGADASLDRLGQALAAYQRTLVAGDSPFDRWRYGGDGTALDQAAARGFDLFTGKGECVACHLVGDQDAMFTDHAFHDTGYGFMREDQRQNPPKTTRVQLAPGVFVDVDFAHVAAVSAVREADLGRYEVTEDPADRWLFRTPTLRNIAMTRPYMHDGALNTLRDVLDFYNRGGPGHPGQSPLIRPLGLSEAELDDIEAFLNSLTSPNLDCLAAEARSHPPDNH
ncbi:cytochrome-c peroxidase [Actibacterium sp. XHP0104]|uniref:cytochrome-c peroxidase n=1 Tax=Actibacterium sp. XHP0104 TaxID=2984335 RepID=UPI0021E80D98|nr:cytochrome c peroxidase [Actibacterium sp. XHP0104]MCV2881694.1 c-type cytochrome [Actibacterium sp. XHP0104]